MRKTFFLIASVICLLVTTNTVSAQLVIRNNGHAEVGTNPNSEDQDTVTVLKIFGNGTEQGAGGHISFGDGRHVLVGEMGLSDCDKLWMHGKSGIYLTTTNVNNANDTLMFYDPSLSTAINFNGHDVQTSGLFIQSDERFKVNIEPVSEVLSSLGNLEAVTYNLKNQMADGASSDNTVSATGKNKMNQAAIDDFRNRLEQGSERYGFLAQNVKQVFPELVHTDKSGYMYVDYIGLIPILVQSINELRAELAQVKQERLDGEQTAPLRAQLQAGIDEQPYSLTTAKLYQNAPNPWSSETVIRYTLPQSVASADIYIYDMQGAQLKRIPAQGRGESQVTLSANDLKAGMYLYALVADGALVDSKQMILTK
jgi:hypothetical protein